MNLSFLLQILYESAQKNADRNKNGHRFTEELYMFSSYVYITAGLMFYENLQTMLGDALPDVSRVKKFVAKTQDPVREGALRCEELKNYLCARNLPLKVWISEDGTRIVSKLKYDLKNNQIVGPVLPLSETSGNPILDSFPATSAAMIAKHVIQGEVASTAYVVMAQPLSPSAHPFCLQIFGTNNKFTGGDVSRRWATTKNELSKVGIEVLGFSGDGDSKVLKAMRAAMFPPSPVSPAPFSEWYCCDTADPITMIQDTIHLLNRFKTRLNKASIVLPLGKYVASASHLHIIVNNVSKTVHGLSDYDLTKADKMNFDATMKMCSTRVVDTLKEHVPSSNGTRVYLDLIKKMEDAFLNPKLLPLERVYNMWYIVFFLRIWKAWLLNSKDYRLSLNFITPNMYMGSEINAHGLVKVIRVLRDSKCDDLFLPILMSSQPCESFFRKARSLTTTESTVINFNMSEFLSKVRKIEFLLDFRCKMEGKLQFAKERRKALLNSSLETLSTEPLPWDQEIRETLVRAMSDASATAKDLGMLSARSIQGSNVGNVFASLRFELDLRDDFYEEDEDQPVNLSNNDFDGDDDIPLDILAMFPVDFSCDLSSLENESFKGPLPPNSSLVQLLGTNGNVITMPKSTLLWTLTTEGPKVSTERGMRVRAEVQKCIQKHRTPVQKDISHNKRIAIGEFCLFKVPKQSNLKLGQVLSFKYLSGANTAYSLSDVPTTPPKTGARGVGVLCSWFTVQKNGKLVASASLKHEYVNINCYKFTVPSPDDFVISQECLSLLLS